eukprot:XP_012813162.1 PREDICTED: uncharacterized protein LOC101730898 isoform X2 [Xenopus tropicalis]
MTSRDVSDAPFRARSDFGPVTSNTSLRTFSRIIDSTVSNIPRQTQHRGNLNKEQRVTLKGLQENRNIIVKPADKGGAVVVMDYEYYRTELLDQLADTGCYQKLTYDPTSKFQSQLGKLLDEACLHGWITEELRDALYVEHPHWPIVKTDAELTAINRKRVRFGYKRNKNLKELLSSADPVCKGVATLIVFYSKEKHFGHMNWIAWLLGA